jgi:hypothetical protein
MTLYSTAVPRSELRRLQVSDIDSQRMISGPELGPPVAPNAMARQTRPAPLPQAALRNERCGQGAEFYEAQYRKQQVSVSSEKPPS